jgi:hypothetical protein
MFDVTTIRAVVGFFLGVPLYKLPSPSNLSAAVCFLIRCLLFKRNFRQEMDRMILLQRKIRNHVEMIRHSIPSHICGD